MIGPSQTHVTWQHTTFTKDRHPCPCGIRTRNSIKRAAANPCLRPRGHWYRPTSNIHTSFAYSKENTLLLSYKVNWIILREKIAVYSENSKDQINIFCELKSRVVSVREGGAYNNHGALVGDIYQSQLRKNPSLALLTHSLHLSKNWTPLSLSVCLSVCLSMSVCLSVRPSVYPSVHPSVRPSIHPYPPPSLTLLNP